MTALKSELAHPGRRVSEALNRLRTSRWTDPVAALTVGVVAVLVALWAMGVRRGDFGIPWGNGDLIPVYSYAENLRRGNWFLINPDLGFPGFQDHGHFPVTDLFSIAQIAVLAHITPSAVAAVNLFALGTFFTIAVATYLVLRWESVDRVFAAPIALAFSLLPWHFVRAPDHAFLASYVSVPLAIFLVGLVARRRLERSRNRWLFPTAIAAAIVVGSNGVYYALMTTIMMGVVLVITNLWPRRTWPGLRTLTVAALVPLTTLGAVLINVVSTSTPSTGDSVVRSPAEAYLYGGNPATLFFPALTTRSGVALGRVLDLGFPTSGTFEGNALLSSAAVIAVLLTCGVVALRWATRSAVSAEGAIGRASFWPGLFLLTTAFFAMGGLGALFSFWISNDIRAWGRFSVFVVGIAFLVAGHVLTAWRTSRYRVVRVGSVLLGVVLAVSAIVDLSAGGQRLPLEWGRALNVELRDYVGAVEQHVDDDCAILQLPLSPYPESPAINRMTDYSHLWTYIYSDDLRWSYGAMKGTPLGDWGMDVQDDPDELIVRARAAGFCGIQVDTWAYANLSEAVDHQRVFGNPEIVSSSGRWAFFDLTGPQPGEYVTAPDAGFAVAVQTASLPVTWWMVEGVGGVRVTGAPGARIDVRLALSSPPCGPVAATIGGIALTVDGSKQQSLSVQLDQEGTASIPVSIDSAPCAIDGEPSPVWLGLAGPRWAPTEP